MILVQGWKDRKVNVIVLSTCQNGMVGWTVYRGTYDPSTGGTYQTAQWECLSSSPNLVDLLYYNVFSEMATWEGAGTDLKNIQDTLITIHNQLKQVAAYVQAAATQHALNVQETAVHQQYMAQQVQR